MKRAFFISIILVGGPLMAGGYGYLDPVMQLYEDWVQTYDITDYVQTLNDTYVLSPVSKSGQVSTYSPGDDGDMQLGVNWPEPRFTDNGDGTVTDHLTGLIWLKDADCGGTMLWQAAVNYCQTIADGQCGLADGSAAGDWRIPNIRELHSLTDYEFSGPALSDSLGTAQWTSDDAFTNVASEHYWSSTSNMYSPTTSAWFINLANGNLSGATKTASGNDFHVWPVRGGPNNSKYVPGPIPKTKQTSSYSTGDDGDLELGIDWPSPRFTDNSDGTVTDNLTELIWLKDGTCGGLMLWQDSMDFCSTLADGLCGLTDGSIAGDWRLPNVREMHSLFDFQQFGVGIPNTAGTGKWSQNDPFTNLISELYWTSTSDSDDPMISAWAEHLYNGIVTDLTKSGNNLYAWPVKGNPLE